MSVYFATCREANAVKIGSSTEPEVRLGEIQWGCPLLLTLEAILPGGIEEEFALHRRFSDDRIRGEWFTITDHIELVIKSGAIPHTTAKIYRAGPPKKCITKIVSRANGNWITPERYGAAMAEMRALDLELPIIREASR